MPLTVEQQKRLDELRARKNSYQLGGVFEPKKEEKIPLKKAIMPNTYGLDIGTVPASKALPAIISDLASFPFRAGTAAVKDVGGTLLSNPLNPKKTTYEEYKKDLAKTGGSKDQSFLPRTIEDMARSPSNMAMLIPPVAPLKGAATVQKLGSLAAKNVPAGLASGTLNQLQSQAKGERFNHAAVGLEGAFSAGIPMLSHLAKLVAGGKAVKILRNAIPASKKISKRGPVDYGAAFKNEVVPNAIEPKFLEKMASNINTKFKSLEGTLQTRLKRSRQKINIDEVLSEAADNLMNNVAYVSEGSNIRGSILEQIKNIKTLYGSDPNVSLVNALKLKRAYGSDGAYTTYLSADGLIKKGIDRDAAVKEIVSAEIYKQINERLKKVAHKDFQIINKKFTELIPIQKALKDRIENPSRSPVSFRDILYTMLGVFGGLSRMDNSMVPILSGVTALGISKATRNPRVASLFNSVSNIPESKFRNQMYRNLMFSKNKE